MIEYLFRRGTPLVPRLGAAAVAAAAGLLCLPSYAGAEVTYKGGSVAELLEGPSAEAHAIRAGLQKLVRAVDDEKLMRLVTGYDSAGNKHDLRDAESLAAYIALDYGFLVDSDLKTTNLAAFLADQRAIAEHVENTPALFKGEVITVGFEHEFLKHHTMESLADAGIEQSDCSFNLTEVDHAELFQSSRIRGLPFKIETDSDNQLELVTPPFLVRTVVEGVPLPKWEHVNAFEEMMTKTLLEPINSEVADATRSKAPLKLPDLAKRLRDAGIDFPAQPVDLPVEPTQLTHRTPAVAVAKLVKAQDLAHVCLHSAKKGDALISHQVNFATDALVFTAHKYVARTNTDPENNWYRLWLAIMDAMKGSAKLPKDLTPAMKSFLLEYAAAAANQAALPAMRAYLDYVRELQAGRVQALAAKGDHDLENYEDLSSFVKDWSVVWLKTSLYNFGCSLLSEGEWAQVSALIADKEFATRLARMLDTKSMTEFYREVDAERARIEIKDFAERVRARFQGPFCKELDRKFEVNGRQIQIFEHNSRDLGPRQDTYIASDQVQMKTVWPGVTLHVVEDREDDDPQARKWRSHRSLGELGQALKNGQNGRSVLEKRIDHLWNLGDDVLQPRKTLEDR